MLLSYQVYCNLMTIKRARKRPKLVNENVNEYRLYLHKNPSLSEIPVDERDFINSWCTSREIHEEPLLLSLTYWLRTRSQVSIFFGLCDSNKSLYMILCIHLALKWLGDEYNRCRFLNDLKEVYPSANAEKHQRMEMELLWALNWEMQ